MSEPQKLIAMNQETKKPSIKLAPTRPRKRIRIFCNDPVATDSSDDDGVMHNKLKRVCFTIEDSNNGEKNPNKPGLVTGKYKGVRLRKWGRWGAEIRDPISRKKIWLGHYNTAEEASHAYEMKRMEFDASINPVDFSSEKSSNNVVQRIEKPKACLSSDSSVTAFSLTSNMSPSSVLEMDSSCVNNGNANSSSIVATNANEPDKGVDSGILDEDLTALAHIGAQIDLDLDRNPLGEFDFAKDFEDIPLFGFENTYSELPDFDFDFDFETWMDDAPIGTNTNGAEPVLNGATLNN